MTIVSPGASQANRQRTKLPNKWSQASVEVANDHANERNAAQRDGFESPARSPTGIRSPPGAREYISGYEQLSKLGVGFYPIHRNKSPAVAGKLDRVVTIDQMKIRFWAEYRGHRSFALRILRGSRLMVIDTESPSKHPDIPGPDGELVLYGLLEEHGITVPPCPTVQTASGGFHRYFLVPKWLTIHPAISLWPGIDILATGSSVILPGSRTDVGEYNALRSFEECPIPEAPRAFIRLIHQAQKVAPRHDRSRSRHSHSLPSGDTSFVSRRQWYLLFKNQVFCSFWNRTGKAADTSDSAYEYHLAKACFCCGLDQPQTVAVILKWREKHGLERSLEQLRNGIIPAAWHEVSSWVNGWRADQAAAKEAGKATKTARMILAYISEAGTPQTPSSIAAALPIPRERAKKAMQRMAKQAQLRRTKDGYIVGDSLGTFCCITTPL